MTLVAADRQVGKEVELLLCKTFEEYNSNSQALAF
jgi:hypothetical protein